MNTITTPNSTGFFRPLLVSFTLLSLITGIIYPMLTTVIGKAAFPYQAAGSLIQRNQETLGSELIGQYFNEPQYFWGRPSATSTFAYNSMASGGSNLGPTNPALKEAIQARIQALHDVDPTNTARIPVDLVTASASGLDPHISPAAAHYQLARVAKVRGIHVAQVQTLVEKYTESPQFGLFGEARVNVLQLNLALNQVKK
ncbi:MAG: potassium-transporting ATPase subunit KdpC [Undibacterium sp.]|nr:potassium-transporting ATPase subunit KdpC [Undibacterium sp.]